MLLARILGAVGKVMMASGVLILLFVAYQLWGTGIRTDQAQGQLRDEFAALQRTVGAGGTLPALDTPGATAGTTAPPSTAAPDAVPASGEIPPPKAGQAIGQIVIPAIGADFIMVEGVDLDYLRDGPGHFPSTPFPGQAGNAALAGHRTTWKAPFNRIDELQPGDTIDVETLQGRFTYEVLPQGQVTADGPPVAYRIVGPNQTEILDQPAGQNLLTLMACHPKYSAAQRIVVVGKLVGSPASPTPRSDLAPLGDAAGTAALLGGSGTTDLIGGDPAARLPALVWGLVAAAVWLVAWLLARRWAGWRHWQPWVVYAVALPLFLLPLFLCFENVNRLLPAGY